MKEKIDWLIGYYEEELAQARADNYSNPFAIDKKISMVEEFIQDLKDLRNQLGSES